MSAYTRRKGPAFERDVADYLAANGHPLADRRVKTGAKDRGDIGGVPGWTLECKNEKTISLAAYMEEARQEAVNAGTANYAAVVKRRGKGVSESYVVLPLAVFVKAVTST